MDAWIDHLANALGEPPLSKEEVDTLLEVARDIAHRVERKVTPLSTFLLGLAVGRGTVAGTSRAESTSAALDALRGTLPDAPEDPV
jgi:hypothetical protein